MLMNAAEDRYDPTDLACEWKNDAAARTDFERRIGELCRSFVRLWNRAPAGMPALGPRAAPWRQWAAAREARRVIDRVAAEIGLGWISSNDWNARRAELRRLIEQFGRERLGWPDAYCRLVVDEEMYAAAIGVFSEARAFDRRIPSDELWQALRNVWVGNSLQLLVDVPVELRPGLFAYSMLYPVTDNLLDDPQVPLARKRRFNERLGLRLAGCAVAAEDEREAQAHRLVERIESDWPRERFPCVYASLLAIHEGQSRSLEQHGGGHLDDLELLRISVRKGGTSVLADLFLVAGTADESQMRVAFGYGVVLQLLDDLQDVDADIAAGHETVFTRAARRGWLDGPAMRLAWLIEALRAEADRVAAGEWSGLVHRHCRAMLVDCIAVQHGRFSRAFLRRVARQWPVSLRAHRRLRHRAMKLVRRGAAENWCLTKIVSDTGFRGQSPELMLIASSGDGG